MAPRLLIAPDKFKGSLTAPGAAEAIARGIAVACPDAPATALWLPAACRGCARQTSR